MTEIEALRAEMAELRKEMAALRDQLVLRKIGPDHHLAPQPPAYWPVIIPANPPPLYPGGPFPAVARAAPTYGPDN
jgi:hypothetical protein